MAGTKQYFRIVVTESADMEVCRNQHEQKLNNYDKYKYPVTDVNLPKGIETWVVPDFEIHHTNLTVMMKGHQIQMVTQLCCEDKEEEGGEY